MRGYDYNKFFCTQCGNEGMPIQRRSSRKKETHHRKQLWCLHCKEETNHIECTNQYEIEEFKRNFENGVYKNETHYHDSRAPRIW